MDDKAGRRGVTAAMEAESREWLVRCPACGDTRSIWDLGGVRYKARGTKMIFRRCAACRQFGLHLLYRERDSVRLPPLRPARPLRQYVGAVVAFVAVFIGLFVGGLLLLLNGVSAGARDVTSSYFAAVTARDWAGAHGQFSAVQRARVSPQDLAAIWQAREGARGPVDNFRVTSFSVRSGRARISGILRYRDGATESRTVWLVRDGGAWKIDSEP